MNIYIVTLKFKERSMSGSVTNRKIIGKWVVLAENMFEAIEDTAEHRGEILEANAVELQGNGIFCLEYNGVSKL